MCLCNKLRTESSHCMTFNNKHNYPSSGMLPSSLVDHTTATQSMFTYELVC